MLSLSPADFAFSLIFCPHPPDPLPPRGRGDSKFSYARGFAPCIPATEPARHWFDLPPLYPAGGVLSLSPADFAFSLIFCPHPPYPLPGGKGETLRLFYARGFAPCIPATGPARHWFDLPIRHPAGVPSESPTRRKSDRTAFLLAVPAAKERGDRGRWNYPSQATAAFEMVLSPGAGIASAAGKIALRARAGGLSFPSGEGGQGSKLKAGQGGDKAGTPPAGYSGGKPSRRPAGHAPAGYSGGNPSRRPAGHAPAGYSGGNPSRRPAGHAPAGYIGGKSSRRPKQSSPPAREAAFNRDSGLITFSASGQQHRCTARPARRRRTAPAPSRNRTICPPPQSFPQLHR